MKYIYTCFALFAFCNHIDAQISHTNISPVRVLNGSASGNKLDSVKMHIAHPLTSSIGKDSALHIWHFDATAPGSKDVGVDCRGMEVELLKLSSSPAPTQYAAIDSGITIDSNAGTWSRPNYERLAIQGAADNWDSKTDKYLGVRFRRNMKWHYGWIKMSIDATPTKCEIQGYAYEITPGKGITAGNKGISTSTIGVAHTKPTIGIFNKTVVFRGVQNIYDVDILDMSGRKIQHSIIDAQNQSISLDHITSGMYIVKMQYGTELIVKKISL